MDWINQSRRYWLVTQKVLVVLLVFLSAIWAARFTWLWLEPVSQITAPTIRPAAASNSNGGGDLEQLAQRLASRELFGEFEVEEAVQEEQRPVEAPDTQLRLTLQAVLAEAGDGAGFAIIAQRNGQSKAFGVGDDVFGQAELAAVYGNRVILNRNGQMETLRYERSESSQLLQPLEVEAPPGAEPDQAFEETFDQAQEEVNSGADMQAQVEQVANYIQQRANSDPEGLLNEVGLEATGEGYRVTRRARQLQMAGLRPGDIVTAVNDNPVGNISQDQALLNQIMQSGGELKIQIQRGSRTFTIYQSIPNF